MNAVEVHNLRKEFVRKDGRKRTRVAALRGITFELGRGECIAILGQNGSGKSTLVRLLSTLLLPDGGTARIYGHDIGETRAVRTMVNRVSVEASFFKKMSATENLAYAARFYGLTPRETRERIPVILDRVGFPVSRRTHSMENLSRGTQQKVALKCLQREAAEENGHAAALFQREYHTLSHLRHPRVIQVFDYGIDAGRPFYTMELLAGADVRELLREGALDLKRTCTLLRDAASALTLIHSRRVTSNPNARSATAA